MISSSITTTRIFQLHKHYFLMFIEPKLVNKRIMSKKVFPAPDNKNDELTRSSLNQLVYIVLDKRPTYNSYQEGTTVLETTVISAGACYYIVHTNVEGTSRYGIACRCYRALFIVIANKRAISCKGRCTSSNCCNSHSISRTVGWSRLCVSSYEKKNWNTFSGNLADAPDVICFTDIHDWTKPVSRCI